MTKLEKDPVTEAVERYSDLVFRIAYQFLKNRADAEDIVQETFVKLLNAPAFEDESRRKAWIIRVAVNLCKDLKKSAWHRKRTKINENEYDMPQKHREIMSEVWRLPAKYRNVIYLYYYEDYKIPEIAEILNIKSNTVNSWLTRARKKLKNILSEGGTSYDA